MKIKAIFALILMFTLVGCSNKSTESASSYFRVHFLNVGNADAAIVECDGEFMMIDCGSNNIDNNNFNAMTIDYYVKELESDKINPLKGFKYIFCTHADKDHFTGFITVLDKRKYGTVYAPETSNNLPSYNKFVNKVQKNFLKKIKVPKEGQILSLGSSKIEVLAVNKSEDITDKNDSSIVLMITYGNNKFLFTGDSENITENYLIDYKEIRCDVLKAAHHGSHTSSRKSFLDKAQPEYIVISTAEKDNNDYSQDLLDYIEHDYVHAYFTYETGTIVCSSDGKNIEFFKRNGDKIN